MSELEKCPFCEEELTPFGHEKRNGEVVEIFIHPAIRDDWFRCPLSGLVFDAPRWNTRPGEAAAEQRGYLRAAKDVEENTIKMIAEGVKRGYSEGYLKALDNVLLKSANNPPVSMLVLRWVNELKSDYLRQEGKNGKQS
jgi:hypothetical protein